MEPQTKPQEDERPAAVMPVSVQPPETPTTNIPETKASEPTQVSLWKQLRNLGRQIRGQGLRMTFVEGTDQLSRMLTGAPRLRYSRLTPDVFLGGQHVARGVARLRGRGITGVINLRGESDDKDKGVLLDHYLYLPTMDNTPPTLEHIQSGIDFIRHEIEQGGKVYIHCWEGVGRAATMAAAYLVSTGLTPEEAWAKVRLVRPFIRPTPVQMAQVEQFARNLREGRTPVVPPADAPSN